MYKDRDKQRDTQRERQRRYRRDKKGVTEEIGVTVTDAEAEQIEKDMVKMGFTPVMTEQGHVRPMIKEI